MILSIGWMVLNACGPKEVEVETVKPIVEKSVEIPNPTEANPFSPPQPEVSELNGGGQLWLLEDHDLPLVVFSIVLPGGSAQDPKDKLGQAELANQMLLEAAGGFTASQISNAFYELAADVSIQTTRQHSILQVSAHRDRLSDVLSYVSKMVFEPTFNTLLPHVVNKSLSKNLCVVHLLRKGVKECIINFCHAANRSTE